MILHDFQVSKFHEYVKPIVNPKLTKFCTKLTGITQV
jgi:inhibitor of KinA sporulation pathway (predicted exonuclease)